MGVRERLEAAELQRKYDERAQRAKPLPPSPEQLAQERQARLELNARAIHQQEVELFLTQSGMSPDEQTIIYERLQRGAVNALGVADKWDSELLALRAESENALLNAIGDATPDERARVFERLASLTAAQRLGLDSGRAAAEALRQIRSEDYLED